MVELNHRERTIKVKIVYYGPAVGGKTTNLQVLHQQAVAGRRGEMISINSAQDRTILFDLLPLKAPGFRGFDLRLQLLAVPGQAMYSATRRLVLKGADSLVFVANSAVDRWEDNIQSYREMTQNLLTHHLDPATMPLVFQYNKRDLPQVMEPEIMDRALNGRHADAISAVAVRGEGVLETFTSILMRTVQDLARRYAILDIRDGIPARQWAEQAVLGMFGTTSIQLGAGPAPAGRPHASRAAERVYRMPMPGQTPAQGSAAPFEPVSAPAAPAAQTPSVHAPPPAPPVPAPRTVVRVAPQPEEVAPPREREPSASQDERADGARAARKAAGPDARASETLVESYAEASEQLGAAVTELREERDQARSRLEDLQKTLLVAQEILAGKPLPSALEGVLTRMAAVAKVSHAAFWLPQPGRPPRAAALVGLVDDPLIESRPAIRYVLENAGREPKPTMLFAADNLDLGQALDRGGLSFQVVLAVPFRTPSALQGMAALYYAADTARPAPEAVAHLGEIARALSAALELAATLEKVKAAERALEHALAGTASLKGLEDVVNFLVDVRDRLGEMRGRPDAPSWFLEQFARLAPSLGAALSAGRSLLGFSRGEIEREPVLIEELLGELRAAQVTVRIQAGVSAVSGDAALLRVALRALLDHVRSLAGPQAAVEIRAEASSGWILVSVGAGVALATGSPRAQQGALGLNLAQRIAELHGGSLTTQSVPGVEDWLVLSLTPA